MKRFISILSAILLTFLPVCAGGAAPAQTQLGISAEAAVLYCADGGRVLYEYNSDRVLPMASLTKIMTAVVVIDGMPLDTQVSVDPSACGIEGSSVYLCAGEKLTVEQLLYALLLESANDAAAALAVAMSGSVEAFTAEMNAKAEQIGLKSTHFTNPHGLDNKEHYSCALDLAVLCDYALKNEAFARITGTKKYTIPYGGDGGMRLLINHNRLLSAYEGCIGVKTGYTKKCGRCLVSAVVRDGVTLIAVTLNAPDDWNDHKSMYDWGFAAVDRYTLVDEGTRLNMHVVSGVQDNVAVTAQPVSLVMTEDEYASLVTVYNYRKFYFAPVAAGDTLGAIKFYIGEKCVGESRLYADSAVEAVKYKRSLLDWFFDLFR